MTQPEVAEAAAEETPPRRPRRWLPWAAAGTAVLLLVGVSAWWLLSSARLVVPGDGSFGMGAPAAGESTSWLFGGWSVCVEGVDSVVIDSVEPVSGDAVVTDFAVRPTPQPQPDGTTWLFGTRPGRLSVSGFGSQRTVRGDCADEEYTEMVVELTRGETTSRAEGLLLHWHSGVRSGTARVPATFVLCDSPTGEGPGCEL